MTQLDTVITGGKVVGPSGIREVDVGVRSGKIEAFAAPGHMLSGALKTIDATGRFILPGCVDAHVHTRDPGLTHKEDFATLSYAAAVGGVTTIMCQPTTDPPINTVEVFNQVVEDWPKKSVVDFCIQAMAGPENIAEIPGLLEAGAVSMEFLGPSSTGPMFPELLRVVHENGGLSSGGGGDGGYSKFMSKTLREAGQMDVDAWLSAWPAANESVGVARVLLLTEDTPYRFHFHMLTTRKALELVRQAKQSGRDTLSVETSPKYLLLTEEDHLRMGPYSIVVPRFKSPDDVEAVWEAVQDGTVDMIATDHAPHAREEKEAGNQDIWKAPTGVPEIELLLPLMLTQVNAGRLNLPQLAGLIAESPAKEYGIYPQKGSLQVGSDADMVIVDMDQEGLVEDHKLITSPKYSAFDGTPLKGMPIMTLLRGEVIAKEGTVSAPSPNGTLVRPRR